MKPRLLIGLLIVAVFCFLSGNFTGFFVGVWSTRAGRDFLTDFLTDEQPADVGKANKLVRDGFRLEYPGNWRIDSADEDFDPDHFFSIDSPGSSFVFFVIMDFPSDTIANVDAQIQQYSKLISVSKKTTFKRWGKYDGEGIHLQGRLLFMKGGVKIFSHSSNSNSFTVVILYYDEDLANVEPGFDLIEKTFELSNGFPRSEGGTP